MKNEKIYELLLKFNSNVEYSSAELLSSFKSLISDSDVVARDTQLGAFLQGLMSQNPTSEDIYTLIKYILSERIMLPKEISELKFKKIVCVAGSGKKGIKSFNISTAASILAVSAGAYVVKMGSQSTSSVTGSSDFMSLLGLKYKSQELSERNLLNTGFGFFSIEDIIPKFDKIYGQKMFVPTPLSFALPALISPIKYDALFYGLSHGNIELSKEIFNKFGIYDGIVVASTNDNLHFIDELGLLNNNYLIELSEGSNMVSINSQEYFGIDNINPQKIMEASSAQENVEIALRVLEGKGKKEEEAIVAVNAGIILYLSNLSETIREGYLQAMESIRSGKAWEKFGEIVDAYK